MSIEKIRKFIEGNLIYKCNTFSLWAGDDWGPVLAIKKDEEGAVCDHCDEEVKVDHPYGIKFLIEVEDISTATTVSFMTEEKRNHYFDNIDEKKIRGLDKEMREITGCSKDCE